MERMRNTASSWEHSCARMQSRSPSRSAACMTQCSGSRKPISKLEIIPKGKLYLLFHSLDLWVPGYCVIVWGWCAFSHATFHPCVVGEISAADPPLLCCSVYHRFPPSGLCSTELHCVPYPCFHVREQGV